MDSLWEDTPMRVRRQCYDRFQKALAVYLYMMSMAPQNSSIDGMTFSLV